MKHHDQNNLLKIYESLPDDGRIRIETIRILYGNISTSTVWRMIKSNKIPAPSKMGGRTTTWRVGDLRKALSSKGGNE